MEQISPEADQCLGCFESGKVGLIPPFHRYWAVVSKEKTVNLCAYHFALLIYETQQY